MESVLENINNIIISTFNDTKSVNKKPGDGLPGRKGLVNNPLPANP
jgi:hypothetical protein